MSEKLIFSVVNTLAPLVLTRFHKLAVTRTTMVPRMSSNFNQIPLLIAEVAALESLQNQCKEMVLIMLILK